MRDTFLVFLYSMLACLWMLSLIGAIALIIILSAKISWLFILLFPILAGIEVVLYTKILEVLI